ncbi:MAG: sigma-70 family RNA polymerase sigma factor [Acidimicrobiia bacterium]|nr:MAG: sigma-70 family RNA polymerase sigma factor [Acidimicrobiia bacterium]
MKATGVLVTEQETDARALPPRETFPAFYRREYPKMVAIAAAVSGNRAVAEDLAQEAMLRAHRHWDRVAIYQRPGAWVRRVTINLSLSATKRAAAEMRRMLRISEPSALPEPEAADDRIWKAVAKLPGQQRAAIALFYLEDRPIDEIAEILEVSSATARVHLHRGRQALANALGPEEVSA